MFYEPVREDEDAEKFKQMCIKEPNISDLQFMVPPMGINVSFCILNSKVRAARACLKGWKA